MASSFFRHLSFRRGLRMVVHMAAWLAVAFLPLALSPQPSRDLLAGALPRLLLPVPLLAGFFYLNYWVLIPRLLARRRFVAYFGLVLLFASVLSSPVLLLRVGWLVAPGSAPPVLPPNPGVLIGVVVGLVWVISSGLRISSEWLQSEQLRGQLHSKQLAAELAFLKSQVNPHFLFNTLNNVYTLAELKSDDAPAAILRLSQLMRYMLYEADAPQVPLAREVEYLRNFVELQRLRLDSKRVPIEFQVEGDLTGHLIEPMLLIPFVENAFKHGVSFQQPSRIGVRLRVDDTQLRFTVNNFDFSATADPATGGVGLANVVQRLHLLYPNRHQLVLNRTLNEYIATLTLTFADDSVPVG